MRISTQTLFETGAARLGDLQSGLARTQQQISTGRRILIPSDDPVAAARALEVSQSQSLNTQYGLNRQHAKSALASEEGSLSSVTSLLQDVKTTVIAAGNGSLSDTERGFMATELRGRFEELLGLANSRDPMGNYQFSGYQTTTPPFAETTPGTVQYQGDQGQRLMQVDATRQMAANSTGQAVFQGGGQDIFVTLNDLITLLQTPVVDAATTTALNNGLATANNNLDLALDNVLTVRASVGSRLQELDALDNAGEDRHIQYSQILSDLQDLDYTQALTQLSQQQITLEAAQRSFVAVSGLSLFNFL
ncbi:MAG: flagellar hook-associated protein FlgL [Gammaproteobacteria bacterium]|nr:flagellar hook-associated protein FlgL [Gammaproteobacteria bacterium]MBU1408159.1 flagellar hook-associated protein FlgL [Gammaproteobacteria bacterium]MBU1533223.1 flagellar hook-associated protein FlgL [Gammaproteobacteria bacterium]